MALDGSCVHYHIFFPQMLKMNWHLMDAVYIITGPQSLLSLSKQATFVIHQPKIRGKFFSPCHFTHHSCFISFITPCFISHIIPHFISHITMFHLTHHSCFISHINHVSFHTSPCFISLITPCFISFIIPRFISLNTIIFHFTHHSMFHFTHHSIFHFTHHTMLHSFHSSVYFNLLKPTA